MIHISPATLVRPRRLDIAIKWRFFRHLLTGEDGAALPLYRGHIFQRSGARMAAGMATDLWKLAVDDYVESAKTLLASMQSGFDSTRAICVDPNLDILDGSHRLGCALALHMDRVPVEPRETFAWAPPWDKPWFLNHGMTRQDVDSLEQDLRQLQAA